jgi:hypothetical protein
MNDSHCLVQHNALALAICGLADLMISILEVVQHNNSCSCSITTSSAIVMSSVASGDKHKLREYLPVLQYNA